MAAQTFADLDGLYNNFYEPSKFVFEQEAIMPQLVTIRGGSGVAPRVLSTYDTVTAGTVAFGGTVSESNFGKSPDGTITARRVQAAVLYTRDMADTDPDGYQQSLQMELGNAHARKVDTDHVGLFGSFTTTAGAAGSAMVVKWLAQAMAKMDGQNAPKTDRNAVLHPFAFYDLTLQLTNAGANPISHSVTDLANEAMRQYYMGNMFGMRIFTNSNIGTGTAASHGVFTREAIIHDQRVPYMIELEPEPKQDAVRVHALQYYGFGINRQAAGVRVIADASTPD